MDKRNLSIMNKIIALLFSSLLLLSPLAHSEGFSFLSSEPVLMPVNEAFSFDSQQQGEKVKISWVIADGYYMYRDKLSFSVDGAQLNEVVLPRGKMHQDEYFGEQEVYYSFVEFTVDVQQIGENASLSVTFMGCAEGKLCYPPTKRTIVLEAVDSLNQATTGSNNSSNNAEKAIIGDTAEVKSQDTVAANVSTQDSLSQMLAGDSLLWTLAIFFGLGIGLALTPCVFPMYPILSGIIVGQGEKLSTAKAFTLSMAYVQGMAITYSLLGLVVASAGLKYQAALQHPAVLIVLAILFAVLSLSMFGLYDLKLPAKWQEKMNSLSNNQKGGNLIGVFLMGVLSGLVASPCTTAPLSGALIYVAQSGDLLQGFLALYVLSMGMGIPLLILGTSGGKILPRAGAWMDIIKTIFGFLLISVSIVMLSRIWVGVVSDLLWSVWGLALVGYLMHQNKQSEFNWKQTARSILLIMMLMASFSYGFQAVMSSLGFATHSITPGNNAGQTQAKHVEFIKVKSLDELNNEIAKASNQGKTVMLDLYADWCVACKEFEAITFKDSEVMKRFQSIVLLQADVTKSDDIDIALLEHYDVLGLPTLLMFDENGQQREDLRVTGFLGPKEFVKQLDFLLNK
jgi:thiol:disulfide interchange protein DsbD